MLNDEEKAGFLDHARAGRPPVQGDPPRRPSQRVRPDPRRARVPRRPIATCTPTVDVSRCWRRSSNCSTSPSRPTRTSSTEDDGGATASISTQVDWDAAAGHASTAGNSAPPPNASARCSQHASAESRPAQPHARRPARALPAAHRRVQRRLQQRRAVLRRLVAFTHDLTDEEQRTVVEGLTEEQLAVFDLLLRPAPDLTDAERAGQARRRGAARGPQAREARPRLAQGAADTRRGAAGGRGDAGRTPREVRPASVRAEVRRGVPACVRELLGRRAERV